MPVPDPETREEQYLYRAATGSGAIPAKPFTRKEMYLQRIASGDPNDPIPDVPFDREEMYLDYIAKNGGGGGDITVESLSATENTTYTAPSGKAYSPVVVNVQPTGTKQVSISSNGTTTENVADYASAEITVNVPNSYAAGDEGKVVSNGALVSQSSSSTTQNGTVDTTLINSLSVNVQPEVRESVVLKDVNFYDYDGIRLYSYTAQEFNALSAMPANPTHAGLTAQGWNYTLAEAKTCLTTYGGCEIGQLYITDDGKTRIYIELEEQYKTPRMQLLVSGSVTVDWGDNTTPDTFTGTNYAVAYANHAYSSGGKYMITITAAAGNSFKIDGSSAYSQWSHLFMDSEFLLSSDVYASPTSAPYAYAVRKIEMGNGCVGCASAGFRELQELETVTFSNLFTDYDLEQTFEFCESLKAVILPTHKSTAKMKVGTFRDCASLLAVSLPPAITVPTSSFAFARCYHLEAVVITGDYDSNGQMVHSCYRIKRVSPPAFGTIIGAFGGLFHLEQITIPNTVTSISNSAFENDAALRSITIPASVTSIGSKAFSECKRITEYHLLPTTPPTLSATNAFTGINPNCIIYVPAGKLSAYQSASNWSTYASYMREEPA